MDFKTKIKVAILDFLKKNGKKILIILAIWGIVFLINQFLKSRPKQLEISNSYKPNNPVIDITKDVPKKYIDSIYTTIEKYVDYCNKKEYENAYNMLYEDCKEYNFNNKLQNFVYYVDSIFPEEKIFSIQNFSNVGNVYIYDLTLTQDIEATGTSDGYDPYKERIALIEDNGSFKISTQSYIGRKSYNLIYEDDYIKVKVNYKDMGYSKEEYHLTVTNKTDSFVIISDGSVKSEVTLDLGDQERNATNVLNMLNYLKANETKDFQFIFTKFFDDNKEPEELKLNLIRVADKYKPEEEEDVTQDAYKVYSANIKLNNNAN